MVNYKQLLESILANSINQGFDDNQILKDLSILLKYYEETNTKQRTEIRRMVSDENRLFILALSDRLADKAVNEKSAQFLKMSILLHSIEDFVWDSRENIIRLSVIWHIAEKLKLNTLELFDLAENVSSEQGTHHFKEFKIRSKQSKSLKAMGLIEKIEDGKISFTPKPAPWE